VGAGTRRLAQEVPSITPDAADPACSLHDKAEGGVSRWLAASSVSN
jgi:hypothetical protein